MNGQKLVHLPEKKLLSCEKNCGSDRQNTAKSCYRVHLSQMLCPPRCTKIRNIRWVNGQELYRSPKKAVIKIVAVRVKMPHFALFTESLLSRAKFSKFYASE